MKEIWINLLEYLGLAWWIEVITEAPKCTYYFGPFATAKEAQAAQAGYIEDLEQEGAKGIRVQLKRFKPHRLTIPDEADEEVRSTKRVSSPIFSGQL
ncbi:MAG: DUF1816 domain-containing protein [Elainellaceae cyanobacterium]